MEVEEHKEVEMTDVTSKVYDIIHPTPVSLKQLSAFTISLEIWRYKLNEYRSGRKLEKFYPCRLRKENTWMKTVLPDLPSTIYKTIEQVVSRFGYSIEIWLTQHYERGFCFRYTDEEYVLEDFDDFVCDYDGSIHYARTAERMMRCEGFDSKMKFIIACLYCFEDDIRRIWPSVLRNMMNIDSIRFHECPQLYYWICLLTNELDKIPRWNDRTVDEMMFMSFMSHNRPSVEYFWNRIPLEDRMQHVDKLTSYDFVRFILQKLDDEQLDKFVNDEYAGKYAHDGDGLCITFVHLHCDEWVVLRTWFHIRNILKKSNYTNLIVRMLEIADCYDGIELYEEEKWEYLCCQIWNHSLTTFKPSVIKVISSDSSWFRDFDQINQINVELLLTILQDASSEERNLFLSNCWSDLTKRVRRKNLQGVKLCLENEDEINQFKQSVMINSRDILQYCVTLLQESCFDELNAFTSFCCAELQAARNLKQQILHSTFFDEYCRLRHANFRRIEDLTAFINDAFDNVDVYTDFKNRLISSSSFMKRLWRLVSFDRVPSKTIVKFITTLFSTEETLMQVKKSLIDSFKGCFMSVAPMPGYIDHLRVFKDSEIKGTLIWCMGSNEGFEEIKLSCTSQYRTRWP